MRLNISFKNVTEKDKKFFNDYLPKKLKRLEKFISKYDEDSVKIDCKLEKFATKEAYKVTMMLKLPQIDKIIAAEDDHTVEEATDLSFDKIMIQITKLKKK